MNEVMEAKIQAIANLKYNIGVNVEHGVKVQGCFLTAAGVIIGDIVAINDEKRTSHAWSVTIRSILFI